MGYKRGFYLTKKRKKELDFVYNEIKKLNDYIWADEIQLGFYKKYEKWDEAIEVEKRICKRKIELLEYAKQGYNIEY